MTKFSLMCILIALDAIVSCSSHDCEAAPNCQLFANQTSGIVTLEDLEQKVASKEWITIYYSVFEDSKAYGKCNYKWHTPGTDGIIRRQVVCYKFSDKACEHFDRRINRTADECGRGTDNDATEKMQAKFYSQDIEQYFWYDSCIAFSATNECLTHYLNLIVRKTRDPDSEKSQIDLQGLPWHFIASDIKYLFDLDMSDNKLMKYGWTGPECDFDGNITPSSAHRRGVNYFALFLIFVLTCQL